MFDVKVYNNGQIKRVRSLCTEGVNLLMAKAAEVGETVESTDFKSQKAQFIKYCADSIDFIEVCTKEGRNVDNLAFLYIQKRFDYMKKQTIDHYHAKKRLMKKSDFFFHKFPLYIKQWSDRVKIWRSEYKPESSPALFI